VVGFEARPQGGPFILGLHGRQLVAKLISALLAAGFIAAPLWAEDPVASVMAGPPSAQTDSAAAPSIIVSIDTLLVSDGALHDTLDIRVEARGFALAGGSLKIATDSPFLNILEILPGQFINSCHWALFRALEQKPSVPGMTEQWKITALAEYLPDTLNPPCPLRDGPVTIARLVVSNVHVAAQPDTAAAIFFLYEDCSDNTFSDTTGHQMLISSSVAGWPHVLSLSPGQSGFPATAAPERCIDPRARNVPRRAIAFRTGGVRFLYDLSDSTTAPSGGVDTTGR